MKLDRHQREDLHQRIAMHFHALSSAARDYFANKTQLVRLPLEVPAASDSKYHNRRWDSLQANPLVPSVLKKKVAALLESARTIDEAFDKINKPLIAQQGKDHEEGKAVAKRIEQLEDEARLAITFSNDLESVKTMLANLPTIDAIIPGYKKPVDNW